jgi:hypothetical protein
MLTTYAKVFGVILLAIGLLGFVPGITSSGHLLGIFHVDTIHNFIHIGSGLAALAAGFSGFKASRTYFIVFGVVYLIIAALGFVYGDRDILGLIANNMADNLLHVAIAGSSLVLGLSKTSDTLLHDRETPAAHTDKG